MNTETVPQIHFVKWKHWEDHCGDHKDRPVLFLPWGEGQLLCVPGSSSTQDSDFTLSLHRQRSTSICKTYFSWKNMVLCCSVCQSPTTPSVKSIDNYDELLDTKPGAYAEPKTTEIFCECEMIVESEHCWITLPKKPSSLHIEERREIPLKDVFTYRGRRYNLDRSGLRYHCRYCMERPNPTFSAIDVGLDPINIPTDGIDKTLLNCDCLYSRFSILKHRESDEISVVITACNSGMDLVILSENSEGYSIQPDEDNNLPTAVSFKEKKWERSGHLFERIGKLKNKNHLACLGHYWTDGNIRRLPW